MRKNKKYALGGMVTPLTLEKEDSKYRAADARAPQGMISARGTPAAMGLSKGGIIKKKYVNPVTFVDNLKRKKNK
jgi:hypothetical protein